MSTIRAPYPDIVLPLMGRSIASVVRTGEFSEFLEFYNKAGELVGKFQDRNPSWAYVKALRVVGAFDTAYREILIPEWYRPGSPNLKLPSPPAADAAPYDLSWTLDGRFLAASNVTSPVFTIWQRDGDVFTKREAPAELPGGPIRGLSWSPDGRLLVVGTVTAPYLHAYIRAGDAMNKIPDSTAFPVPPVATAPGNGAFSVNFSPDGRYLAVGVNTIPDLVLYDRGIDPYSIQFSRVSDLSPSDRPGGTVTQSSWSPDMRYLATVTPNTPNFAWYKRSGRLLSKLPLPSGFLIGDPSSHVSWQPTADGRYLAIGSSVGLPKLHLFKREGDTIRKIETPAGVPETGLTDLSWTPDGRYLAVTYSAQSPNVFFYKPDPATDQFTYVGTVATPPGGSVFSSSFSPDGKHLAVGSGTAPYISIYKSAMGPVNGAATRMDTGLPLPGGALLR